ncbi:MAG TPA: hypothetical protein PLH70_02895 [Bacteroidales bacterium]|nr:hypothetical protein [Bacteroidales bacterium]HOH23369.1 hypothetical protein [Bacteroidales bacterium]HPZ03110.1 hypothetical protein [Bacteroidales bacterium]HQB74732.1 hypothetical protein [Bacteroidales bacterium]HQQ20588.1 hypothetical protein [Bacteroidales bacterium]
MKKRVCFYRLWIVGIAILCALTMGSCSSSRTTVHKKPTGYTKVRQHQRSWNSTRTPVVTYKFKKKKHPTTVAKSRKYRPAKTRSRVNDLKD